jgi:uncharacterized protein
MRLALGCPYFRKAFGYCVPIGGLGGLVGLGGGEFRLPVLMHAIGFDARSAVPLNLIVSFITLSFALATRWHAAPLAAAAPHSPEIAGLAIGGMASAIHGARLVRLISNRRLIMLIAALLGAIGILLLLEAALQFQNVSVIPDGASIRFLAGLAIGLVIGLVASILGVAGGELLIPSLMFVFGLDIKTAGSASALISLVIVAAGIGRYWRLDAIPKGYGVRRIILAMGAGTIVGVVLGGLAVAVAPVELLKLALGCVLIAAAAKTVSSRQ